MTSFISGSLSNKEPYLNENITLKIVSNSLRKFWASVTWNSTHTNCAKYGSYSDKNVFFISYNLSNM